MKPTSTSSFEESAGLRQTLLAYLPEEVGEALSVLTSYIYDQALAEGGLPGGEAYVVREARALAADLRYVEARLALLAEVGEQTTLPAAEIAILARAEASLPHLRQAAAELAQVLPVQDGEGSGIADD